MAGWWHDWREARCVLVDEIGTRKTVTDHQYETLKRLIDERERVGGPAVFVSNVGLEDLGRLYDDRIASRLAAGTMVVFGGEDRRVGRAI